MVLSVSCKGAENIHFIFISFVDVHIKQPGEFKRFLFFALQKHFWGRYSKIGFCYKHFIMWTGETKCTKGEINK